MLVLAAADHRTAAFEGASYVMDYLKTDAPFWKKEHGPASEGWVAAKEHDDAERKRWMIRHAKPTVCDRGVAAFQKYFPSPDVSAKPPSRL